MLVFFIAVYHREGLSLFSGTELLQLLFFNERDKRSLRILTESDQYLLLLDVCDNMHFDVYLNLRLSFHVWVFSMHCLLYVAAAYLSFL